MKIAYYITAHGYGHGARSCDILNALHEAAPDTPVIAKTDLPSPFMKSRLSAAIEVRRGAFDVGLVQKDSIHVDLEASLESLIRLYEHEEELIQQEIAFIQRENIGVLIADIPAIPLAAAQRAGIPAIATSNFGWDWIYDEFVQHDPRWQFFVNKIRAVYAQVDLLLRQPFAEPMEAFPRRIDLPLLAKPGIGRRPLIAGTFNANPSKTWVLLSFTSLNLDEAALKRLATLTAYEFFSVEPLQWAGSAVHCISRSVAGFPDILASMDVVVTKPGFGILSECIANRKPLIYSDRANFREYGVLVECIRKYCRQAFIPNAELYSGKLERALREIESAPEPKEKIAGGGAEFAAGIILGQLNSIR